MCDEEIDFMVISSIISNLVNLDGKINPVKYSLRMFIMMTVYNFIDILKTSDVEYNEVLCHNLLTETNQVFDILLMEGSIKPLFEEEPEEIKEYSLEVSQKVLTLFN
jgi:hypothetical protein